MTSYSTSDKTDKVKIRIGKGMAGLEPKTLVQSFDEVCTKYGDKPALHQKVIALVSFKISEMRFSK